jgi:hypothetical protein
MSEVTLTFTCTTNTASLLLTFYDLVSGMAPDDSIAAVEHIAWLIDEIGGRAATMLEYLELEKGDADWQVRELARMYEHLPRLSGS